MNSEYTPAKDTGKLTGSERTVLIVLAVVMVIITIGAARFMISNKPTARRRKPQKSAPTVSVISVESTDRQVKIPAMGTVEPELQISLVSKVNGEILSVHPEFLPGGVVSKGDTLMTIDPVDYRSQLAQAEAQLEQARLDLKLEEGKQIIAEKEWRLMGSDPQATDLEKELILRRPQLRKAEASVRAAGAAVEKARSDLNRTKVKAPFNAVIRTRSANVGDQASAQKTLATLIGTDTFHVTAPVSMARLPWLEFFSESHPEAGKVAITSGNQFRRFGRLKKLLSDVEPGGRMAQVLIEIDDPMNLGSDSADKHSLLIGEYVQLQITGRMAENVCEIPREALRDNSMVWLVSADNTLLLEPVEVIWRDPDAVLVRGLAPGAQLIVSDLSSPVAGMDIQK